MSYDDWKLETPTEHEKETCDACFGKFDSMDMQFTHINLRVINLCPECYTKLNNDENS